MSDDDPVVVSLVQEAARRRPQGVLTFEDLTGHLHDVLDALDAISADGSLFADARITAGQANEARGWLRLLEVKLRRMGVTIEDRWVEDG